MSASSQFLTLVLLSYLKLFYFLERVYLKKTIFDQLYREKIKYRFKNMDIKQGKLVSTVFHDAETIKRHEEFNIRVQNLFE